MIPKHTPVLVSEILNLFQVQSGDTLLDATAGLGGHIHAYLKEAEGTTAIGLDADAEALKIAAKRLTEFDSQITLHNVSYIEIEKVTGKKQFTHILFDLGIGSHQLSDPNRGFSFESTAPLTMRYGQTALPPSSEPAINWLEEKLNRAPEVTDILHGIPAQELEGIMRRYSGERMVGRIVKAIKKNLPINSAKQLATVIAGALPPGYEGGRIHPATRTFQALRIVVNRELEALRLGLAQAEKVLAPKGKIAVLSFHSLEDKIVKQHFKESAHLEVLTKKPIVARGQEIQENPRSRSAKLRAAMKKH